MRLQTSFEYLLTAGAALLITLAVGTPVIQSLSNIQTTTALPPTPLVEGKRYITLAYVDPPKGTTNTLFTFYCAAKNARTIYLYVDGSFIHSCSDISYCQAKKRGFAGSASGREHLFKCRVYTKNGIVEEYTIPFYVYNRDVEPPSVSVSVNPNSGDPSTVFNILCTATDNIGVKTIKIFVDGLLKQTCNDSTTCQYSGAFSVGTHTAQCEAADLSDNTNSASATFTVTEAGSTPGGGTSPGGGGGGGGTTPSNNNPPGGTPPGGGTSGSKPKISCSLQNDFSGKVTVICTAVVPDKSKFIADFDVKEASLLNEGYYIHTQFPGNNLELCRGIQGFPSYCKKYPAPYTFTPSDNFVKQAFDTEKGVRVEVAYGSYLATVMLTYDRDELVCRGLTWQNGKGYVRLTLIAQNSSAIVSNESVTKETIMLPNTLGNCPIRTDAQLLYYVDVDGDFSSDGIYTACKGSTDDGLKQIAVSTFPLYSVYDGEYRVCNTKRSMTRGWYKDGFYESLSAKGKQNVDKSIRIVPIPYFIDSGKVVEGACGRFIPKSMLVTPDGRPTTGKVFVRCQYESLTGGRVERTFTFDGTLICKALGGSNCTSSPRGPTPPSAPPPGSSPTTGGSFSVALDVSPQTGYMGDRFRVTCTTIKDATITKIEARGAWGYYREDLTRGMVCDINPNYPFLQTCIVNYYPPDIGTYTLTCVADYQGQTASDTKTIIVQERPPNVSLSVYPETVEYPGSIRAECIVSATPRTHGYRVDDVRVYFSIDNGVARYAYCTKESPDMKRCRYYTTTFTTLLSVGSHTVSCIAIGPEGGRATDYATVVVEPPPEYRRPSYRRVPSI